MNLLLNENVLITKERNEQKRNKDMTYFIL